uniref:Uncharacterized protein n=1 Tax=Anopheles arabiensis TaxID=7173 RepID=A0A182HZI8_ANOAR
MAAAVQGSPRTGDESSESENETEPAKIFHRKLSTKKDVKSAPCKIRLLPAAAAAAACCERDKRMKNTPLQALGRGKE